MWLGLVGIEPTGAAGTVISHHQTQLVVLPLRSKLRYSSRASMTSPRNSSSKTGAIGVARRAASIRALRRAWPTAGDSRIFGIIFSPKIGLRLPGRFRLACTSLRVLGSQSHIRVGFSSASRSRQPYGTLSEQSSQGQGVSFMKSALPRCGKCPLCFARCIIATMPSYDVSRSCRTSQRDRAHAFAGGVTLIAFVPTPRAPQSVEPSPPEAGLRRTPLPVE